MKKLIELFTKYKLFLLGVLKPLGLWGLGGLALLDSAAIPVPIDLILAGYVWQNKKHFYLYVLAAAAGSAAGSLAPFLLGRAGGELFLMKRVQRKKFESLRDRFEKQEFLAVMIPLILPPPTPCKLFIFGAGVFEMKVANFILAAFVGRLVRFSITALFTIEYGPQIVKLAAGVATRHSRVLFAGFLVAIVLCVLWVVRKWKGKRRLDLTTPNL